LILDSQLNRIFAGTKIFKKMTTYQVQINETEPLGQSIVALLHSAKGVVTSIVKKREQRALTYEEVVNKSDFHRSLDSAFRDVRLMLDGKKPKKTAQQLLYELRNGL
jgi:hypothetical protein